MGFLDHMTTCGLWGKTALLFRTITMGTAAFLLFSAAPAHGEPLDQGGGAAVAIVSAAPSSSDRLSVDYLKGYVSDSGKMLAAPVDWGGREWLTLGGIAVATYGLFQVDAEVRNYFQRNQSSGADRFASVGNALGNPLFIVPPLGALYLFGSFTDDVTARRAALLSVESLVISGLFTQGIKVLAERHRPFTGDSSGTWDGPKMKNFNSSFPSGHTTSAFSVASVVAEEYGANPLVPPVAYGLATLTGLSRIYGDYHWASDTFVGAVLGYVVGKAVVRFHPAGGERRVMVLPVYSQKWQGVSVSVRF